MNGGSIIGLVAVVMAFSIPILAIVAGILKARYRAQLSNVTEEDRGNLRELNQLAESLTQRVNTLESILDDEVPDWRDDHDQQ